MLYAASIFVHTKDCTDLEIRTVRTSKIRIVRPPVYAEPLASIFVLVSKPCDVCPSSAKMSFSQARKCSLYQQPKNGAPSLP
jgi:hypothetical protein